MRNRTLALASALLAAAAFSAMSARPVPSAPAQAAKSADKPAMDSEVAAVYKQITAAYQGLKSYQHTEIYTIEAKTPQGDIKRVHKYMVALDRPNKFVFKSDDPNRDAAVSDGKTFINYRHGEDTSEYTKVPAPATLKDVNIVDDVQPQAQASYLIALALQGDILADKDMTKVMALGKMGARTQEDGVTCQTLVIAPNEDATMTLYVDADTHRLNKVVQQIKSKNVLVTEQFQEVQINKPVDDAVFKYTPPEASKLVAKLTDPAAAEKAAMQALAAKYEGKPAPDFTAQDRYGHEVKLSSLKGKVVIVDVWASWCVPCRMVMPTLQEIHDKYASQGVEVLAVNSWDTKGDCQSFLKSNPQYTMTMLLDPAGDRQPDSIAITRFGVEGIPTTLFIDKKGVVRKYAALAHEREFYFDTLKEMGVQTAAK